MPSSEWIYSKAEVITFGKTTNSFGGLSNMAAGYPLFVNETIIANSEVLYQACKFPLFPDIQQELIAILNPIKAKEFSRKHNNYTRQDWEQIKFEVMRWCLKVKLLQNFEKFSALLSSTGVKPIVEYSEKDMVWGARPVGVNQLIGTNALGRLLMEIREDYIINNNPLPSVQPPNIPAFLLFGFPIGTVRTPAYALSDLDDIYAC